MKKTSTSRNWTRLWNYTNLKKQYDKDRTKKEKEWQRLARVSKENPKDAKATKESGNKKLRSKKSIESWEQDSPIFLHQTSVKVPKSPQSLFGGQKATPRSFSSSRERDHSIKVPQRQTLGRYARHVPIESDDLDSKEEETDEDSLCMVDFVDLTQETAKIEDVSDIVDLTSEI